MKHKTQKNDLNLNNYNFAYVSTMAVLIIFPAILQTVINLIMLSIGGQGAFLRQVQTLGNDTQMQPFTTTSTDFIF